MSARQASDAARLRRDIFANLVSSVWMPLMWVFTIPAYSRSMGAESFGLIALFTSFQAFAALLDFGLGATLSREIAGARMEPEHRARLGDTVRTMEIAYWLVALFAGAVILGASAWITGSWLKPARLGAATVHDAVCAMGIALMFQWPLNIYSAGLTGLNKHGSLAIINIVFLTTRYVGVLPILWFVSAAPTAFFGFQALVGLMHTGVAATWLWFSLPALPRRPKISLRLLMSHGKFATGVFGIAVIELILMQADKIILSRMIALEMFGYYCMASMIAMSIHRLVMPVFSAVYPRFVGLVGDQSARRDLYHVACQTVAVLTLAPMMTLALFPVQVLQVWLADFSAARHAGPILALLAVGSTIRGLVFIPHALQLSVGWTNVGLITSALSLAAFVPGLALLASAFGVQGAAIAWLVTNVVYTASNVWMMHRRLIPEEASRWLASDVLLPLIGPMLVAMTAFFLWPEHSGRILSGALLIAMTLAGMLASLVGAPVVRRMFVQRLSKALKST